MIEVALSVNFFISILDNGYSVLITINSQMIRMLKLSIEKYFIFKKFHLILICLFVPKMKKIVSKYVVCYSNN